MMCDWKAACSKPPVIVAVITATTDSAHTKAGTQFRFNVCGVHREEILHWQHRAPTR